MSEEFPFLKPRSYQSAIQAAATDMRGAVVNQDYIPIIGDYQRKNAIFWDLIYPQNKKYATSDVIKEITRNRYPRVGGTSRDTLNSVVAGTRNTQESLARDFTDPGQIIKATYGDVDASYFEKSLQKQQGNIWGNTFAENTDDLLTAGVRYRDKTMFSGDATVNPFEFNGLVNLMSPTSTQTYLDMRSDPKPEIYKTIIRIGIGVSTEPNETHSISHIFSSGSGHYELIDQVADTHIYENKMDITPGHTVPAILVSGSRNSLVPIVCSPYLMDELDVPDPENPGGSNVDLVHYYLVDMDTILWYGVVPFDGKDNLDLQVFDLVSNTINNPSLVERRFLLQFGCLYALNGGRGIHRLTLKLEPGTAYARETTAVSPVLVP